MGFLGGFQEWVFITAFGERRSMVGILVIKLAVAYEVEDGLAGILPASTADL